MARGFILGNLFSAGASYPISGMIAAATRPNPGNQGFLNRSVKYTARFVGDDAVDALYLARGVRQAATRGAQNAVDGVARTARSAANKVVPERMQQTIVRNLKTRDGRVVAPFVRRLSPNIRFGHFNASGLQQRGRRAVAPVRAALSRAEPTAIKQKRRALVDEIANIARESRKPSRRGLIPDRGAVGLAYGTSPAGRAVHALLGKNVSENMRRGMRSRFREEHTSQRDLRRGMIND